MDGEQLDRVGRTRDVEVEADVEALRVAQPAEEGSERVAAVELGIAGGEIEEGREGVLLLGCRLDRAEGGLDLEAARAQHPQDQLRQRLADMPAQGPQLGGHGCEPLDRLRRVVREVTEVIERLGQRHRVDDVAAGHGVVEGRGQPRLLRATPAA